MRLVFQDIPGTWHTVDYKQVTLTQVSWETTPKHPLAFVFFGHANIDFDGSSTAYGPPDIVPPPDDCLSNAGNATQGWFGLFAMSPGNPLVISKKVKIDEKAPMFQGEQPVVQQ